MTKIKLQTNGFTLIELLLVVGLVGLLLIWATPQFLTFNRRQVLQAAADKVVADLKGMQSSAEAGVNAGPVSSYLYSVGVGSSAPEEGYLLCGDDCTDPNNQLDSVTPADPVCVKNSSPVTFGFKVPTGQLVDVDGYPLSTTINFNVCYPGNYEVGRFEITVEPSGRIYRGTRQDDNCSCP